MKKLMTADQAVRAIPDAATVSIPGNASIMVVDHLLAALEARFLREGAPRDLTAFLPCNAGLGPGTGVDRFAHPGLLKRYVASAFPIHDGSALSRMILAADVEAYNFPMGVLYGLVREAGAGRPGLVTEVGIGTYVDPDGGQGGKMNARTTEDLVEPVTLAGKKLLFYRTQPIDVVFLKATTADEKGNLSFEREPLTLGALSLAIAAKANGGKVFAQVERIAAAKSLHPKSVVVPGHLVDGVVLAPDAPPSATGRYDPALTGESRVPVPQPDFRDVSARIIISSIARRLSPGWMINLGVGIPSMLPVLLAEAGVMDAVTLTTEHGGINGFPNPLPIFGAHSNPEAILDPPSVFDMYDGGTLDATLLGMAQADAVGDVNVSCFNGKLMGCGGFIDITSRTRNIYFCGTLTAAGAAVSLRDGALVVERNGRVRKLVCEVEHRTFNGRQALARGQNVTLATERGSFSLTSEGWVLTEIVPGVDPMRDIAPHVEFELRISPKLTTLDVPLTPGTANAPHWLAERLLA